MDSYDGMKRKMSTPALSSRTPPVLTQLSVSDVMSSCGGSQSPPFDDEEVLPVQKETNMYVINSHTRGVIAYWTVSLSSQLH